MCIGLEKLKAHSVFIVWLLAMVVFSFLFWFTITPLLFPYSGKKGKNLSQTYIPEFGLIGFIIWIIFVMACWCCFRKLIRGKDEDRGESSRLMNPEDAGLKKNLNGSIKKRLGLLAPDDSAGSAKSVTDGEKIEVSHELKGEEMGLQEVQEDRDKSDERDKQKKMGLLSRLSSMRRNKTGSDEPEMKIISLPDFNIENSFKLLMRHECEHCFPFSVAEDACSECGKVHRSTESEVRLSWNSRKRKDLSVDLGEDVSTDEYPTSAFSNETITPDEGMVGISENVDIHPGKEGNHKIKPEEDESSKKERKSLKKTESLFLLQALNDQKNSKSEIFFVVNDYGRLVDEPAGLAKLHGFKH